MNRIITLTLILALLHAVANGNGLRKNFKAYYEQVNAAEEAFVNGKTAECLAMYDKVFREYDEPFVKDCYIAAQIAWSVGDTVHFVGYLDTAFKHGMPLEGLTAAPMLRDLPQNSTIYPSLERDHAALSTFFHVNRDEVDTLMLRSYLSDSLKAVVGHSRGADLLAAKAFEQSDETFRRFVYQKYMSKGIFPSEKITGIKTDSTDVQFLRRYDKVDMNPHFNAGTTMGDGKHKMTLGQPIPEAYGLYNILAFNIFIHSTCTMKEYGDALWTCVLNGYLHPKDYGMLEEMCISWNRSSVARPFGPKCEYKRKNAYYNILATDPFHEINTFVSDPGLLEMVEQNRKAHLMQKYSVDVRKHQLQSEKGFKFFFGFMDFR